MSFSITKKALKKISHEEASVKSSNVRFITISHPSQSRSSTTRQAIRSHVTKRQHLNVRLRQHKQAERAGRPVKEGDGEDAGGQELVPSNEVKEGQNIATGTAGSAAALPSSHNGSQNAVLVGCKLQKWSDPFIGFHPEGSGGSQRPAPVNGHRAKKRGSIVVSISPVDSTPMPSPSADQILSPGTRELLGSMEDYMRTVFSPLGWSKLNISNEEGLAWESCLVSFSRVEPALYWARMLFAAGHLSQMRAVREELCGVLYERAIAAVYQALTEECRSNSTGLILATGRLAFYESMFGDKQNAHHLHRPAQYRMIRARGGLDNLQLPPVMKHMMKWADGLMALQNDDKSLLVTSLSGNDAGCSQVQSLQALQLYLPNQYATLLSNMPAVASGSEV